jgi:UDP-3-O-acyl N-acetylglucosamine deacetylase
VTESRIGFDSSGRVSDQQQTLAAVATVRGIGFVTGADVTLTFHPAAVDTGIVFRRTDLPGGPRIPVSAANSVARDRRTALAADGAVVEMTEHVLAALAGLGIDNCAVEVSGGETPGVDGSAAPFVRAILAAGIVAQPASRRPCVVREVIQVSDRDSSLAVEPSPDGAFEIDYTLDYSDVPGIGRQRCAVRVAPDVFRWEIAPARTFILDREINELRQAGLGRNVSAKDLLVFDAKGKPVHSSLRFVDECVRHKILDIIGDFALLGSPLIGRVIAQKSGHRLNRDMAARLAGSTKMAA